MDLTKKMHLLQNDHKSNIEFFERSKKAQQEEIQHLKDEIRKLRTQLLKKKNTDVPKKDDISNPEFLRAAVEQARKEGNDLKAQAMREEKFLDELRDQVRALELELSGSSGAGAMDAHLPLSTVAGAPDDRIQALNSQIEKTLSQCREAHSIVQTYHQIVKHLKDERVSFDQQISALERTGQLKEHDLEELVQLSNDANHAQDVAQQDLVRQRAEYSEARSRREAALRERQRFVQLQLRKRRQEHDQSQSKARQSMDGSKSQGHKDEEEEENEEESEVRFVALKTELERVRQCIRRVKGMVGIAEAHEVLPKLEQQMENMQHLLKARAENQDRLERLQKKREALKVQVEMRKYLPHGDKSDGLPDQLASRRERLGEVQARYEQLSILIANLKCGITEHLWQALETNDKQVRIPPTAVKEGHEVEALQRMLKDIENGLVEMMKKTG